MSSVTYSVGMLCEAVWAEDGKLYPAKVLSVFTRGAVELCRVKFLGYNDEAEVLVGGEFTYQRHWGKNVS